MELTKLTIDQKLHLALDQHASSTDLEALATDTTQGHTDSFDETYALRCNVAANPSAPLALLTRLAEDDEPDVRYAVASNPSIPQAMIERFSEDDSLVEAVASNKSCPPELLRSLSKSKDESLRETIAGNPQCPLDVLEKWSKLKTDSIRGAIASNPCLPVEMLGKLASDKEAYVRMMLASNPTCPANLLVQLANDDESEVRQQVAHSKECPIELLVKLREDPDEFVVKAVAGNSHTPLSVLQDLASHENGQIRLAVATNQKCPEALGQLARTIPTCTFPDNQNISNLLLPVLELTKLLKEAASSFPDHPFLQHPGIEDIAYCAPAWNPKIFDLPTAYADRSRSMLEGPFLTTENYPWPLGGDASFASPVVQLDLSEISKLRNSNCGNGLLQAFIADSEFFIRVIPRSEVEQGHPTEIPSQSEDDYSGYLTEKYWLGDGGIVSQIIGYEEPALSANVYADDGAPSDDDPEIFGEIFSQMQLLCMNDTGIHMFGTFAPIQYKHSEVRWEVLMTLDSERCYNWGDCGSAQIFVQREQDGAIAFSAKWSS